MNRLTIFLSKYLGDVGLVFYVSVLIITAFVTTAALYPDAVESTAQQILDLTARKLGWMYLVATTGFVLFVLFLAFSKYGSIRLGAEDEAPEFSFNSWPAMIFSGGMGVGLANLGVAAYSATLQFYILGGLATLFIISAMTYLNMGIRYLSNANMVLAAGLLVFVLITGPTGFIFGELIQTMTKLPSR